MPKHPISSLREVPLREVWAHEALDFTPWLQDNLFELSQAIEIDLQNPKIHQPVGDFEYDMICEDSEGRKVLIENQLDKTDHKHLGQIITYQAAEKPEIVIWITKDGRDEHIASIDLLNEITSVDYFLIKVKAVRIEDSPAAPQFEILSKPNDWEKSLRTPESDNKSKNEKRQSRILFWDKFEKLNEKTQLYDHLLGARGNKAVYDISLGGARTYIRLKKLIDRITVELITEKPTDRTIQSLKENLSDLEIKVGKIEFISEEGCKRKRFVLTKEMNTKDENNKIIYDWFSENANIFHSHFYPVVMKIKN